MTTLFFRVEKEDDYRIRGLSKERHLGLQIVIGFLVDERGFPVQLHSFEGNKAETLTLVPVLDAFRRAHPNVTVSVACDAGMLSASNLTALEDAGYGFIVGSRIAKTPYDIAEYPNDGSALANGQILDTTVWFRRAGSRRQRRVVCQYRQKRARLDLRNIDTQVEKANRIIEGTSAMKKGRFLKVAGATKALDTALVTSAKSRAGVKGCVINLDTAPAEAIIDAHRQLSNVEASFRAAKNKLRARHAHHRHLKRIDAHPTIVFAAIAVSRHAQETTGISIKRPVKLLAPVKDGVFTVDGNEHLILAEMAPEIEKLLT